MSRLAGVGVVCHLVRPSVEECARLAAAAEEAGADWCVLPDALGWRDVWMCLYAAAAATSRILLGPGVTNPYTRHPLITLAALATLHEVSGGRALLGIAAGGSELPAYAGIDRRDAPERVRELVDMVRRSAEGDLPLPLAMPVSEVPVLGGARGRRMLVAVGDCCDVALLWGQTHDDLESAVRVVAPRRAAVAWSPLRRSEGLPVRAALVYGLLNSPERTRRALGVDPQLESRLRERLLAEGMDAAASLVPEQAASAFLVADGLESARAQARRMGAEAVVVQAFDIERTPERVAWARSVLAGL
jgi:alkanesulfonate monooxygenase SsuD/methylene tetrahydromethanopterin reductase-like flavin-dependent oxidoreductase (luciferase family)